MAIKGSFSQLQDIIAIVKIFGPLLLQNLAGSHVLQLGSRRWPHISIPRPRFACSLHKFHGATMTMKD